MGSFRHAGYNFQQKLNNQETQNGLRKKEWQIAAGYYCQKFSVSLWNLCFFWLWFIPLNKTRFFFLIHLNFWQLHFSSLARVSWLLCSPLFSLLDSSGHVISPETILMAVTVPSAQTDIYQIDKPLILWKFCENLLSQSMSFVLTGLYSEMKKRRLWEVAKISTEGVAKPHGSEWALSQPVAAALPFTSRKGQELRISGKWFLLSGIAPWLSCKQHSGRAAPPKLKDSKQMRTTICFKERDELQLN